MYYADEQPAHGSGRRRRLRSSALAGALVGSIEARDEDAMGGTITADVQEEVGVHGDEELVARGVDDWGGEWGRGPSARVRADST
jgi:hypothetical protein